MPKFSRTIRLLSGCVTLISAVTSFVRVADAQGTRVPIPQSTAEVTGPALGPTSNGFVSFLARITGSETSGFGASAVLSRRIAAPAGG